MPSYLWVAMSINGEFWVDFIERYWDLDKIEIPPDFSKEDRSTFDKCHELMT
ncbi:hypothetical protein F7734_26420 [Scytonema sp. UIC 10036]|uniref:hypothetical protein n=1 Tax=Scytonema sp. UIC 10036 TaxID=2304196 RepID=UPI0012DA946E|nr:hypothetical protein [Scytonema sp. UIC 10036]MUG95698.1 hypothetical protein [Scytonema sp. UIC 10036]